MLAAARSHGCRKFAHRARAEAVFTIVGYAGNSVDLDISYRCRALDQRLCLGTDFPEYAAADVMAQFNSLTGFPSYEKRANILHRNLDRLFPVVG